MKKMFLGLFVASCSFGWTHLSSNIKGWNSQKVTFYVDPTNCTLPEAELYELLDKTINAWNAVPHSGLEVARATVSTPISIAEFSSGAATEVPVILCDPNMENADSIPGVTPAPTLNSAGQIVYGGLFLNANTSGAAEISKLSRGELEVTIAHEIGHVLGLGHSSDADALMYYSIGAKEEALLTQDDMDGIAQIYPKSDFSGGAFGCASVHGKSTTQSFYWFWIGLLFVCSNIFFYRNQT